MTTAHPAIAILKSIATNGHRYMDVIYGPRAATIRQQIASEIHGEPLTKSDKRCQYGNLRAALDSSNTENPEVETGAGRDVYAIRIRQSKQSGYNWTISLNGVVLNGRIRRPSIEAAQKEVESHLPGDVSAWSVKVMDEKEMK